MTTYTTAQMATRVLKDLGLIAAEETPSAADMDWATETVQSEIMMMAAKGIPVWNGSEVEIPQEYLTLLSRRIGLTIAPSFGLVDLSEAALGTRAAEADLRVLGAKPGTGSVVEMDYF